MSIRIELLVEVDPATLTAEELADLGEDNGGPFYDIAKVTPTNPGEFARYDFDSDEAKTGSIRYNRFFTQVIPDGIRILHEKRAAEVAQMLEDAANSLRDVSTLPAWFPFRAFFLSLGEVTAQNEAAHILSRLASWAKEHPQGIFQVY